MSLIEIVLERLIKRAIKRKAPTRFMAPNVRESSLNEFQNDVILRERLLQALASNYLLQLRKKSALIHGHL